MRSSDFDPAELFQQEDLMVMEQVIQEGELSQPLSPEQFMELVRSGQL